MKLNKIFVICTAKLCIFLFANLVFGNVGESSGFGSRLAALGGAGVAGGFDGYAAYHNPAGLSLEDFSLAGKGKRLLFSYGLIYLQPNFKSISNVLIQNYFTADGQLFGNVDTTYKPTFGSEVGLSYRVLPEWGSLTVGLATFLPVSQLAYMDSGEAYIPEYVLYRARTQRPQLELGLGVDLGKGYHLGFGMHMAFSLTSNGSVFVNTKTSSTSTMRFTSSMTSQFAPYFGILYIPPDLSSAYSIGGVFRFPAVSDNTMVLKSSARVFGNFAAVDFNFKSLSALFYDPMAIELGGVIALSNKTKIYAQIDYQFWSAFQSPALLLESPQTTNCTGPGCSGGVTIAPGILPAFSYVNIWVPRLGFEYAITLMNTLRLGYTYRPSIFASSPTDAGNFLDPNKHIFTWGWGLKFQRLLSLEIPCQLDFHATFQYLERQYISKSSNNEGGLATDSKIGSPGYDAGGNLYGGGVSLSLAL